MPKWLHAAIPTSKALMFFSYLLITECRISRTLEENFGNYSSADGKLDGLQNIQRFHLLRGNWESSSVWRDDNLCHPDKVPNGCPTESMKFMSDTVRSKLSERWFFFYGDSTMKQIAREFSNQFMIQNVTLREDKVLFQKCPPQKGRNSYVPPENDNSQCFLNEKVCNEHFQYGTFKVRRTKDWKHFIYEDYDEWLFSKVFPSIARSGNDLPDVMVVSTGMHSCFHFEHPKWLPKHFRHVDDLLEVVTTAEWRPKQVIFMDSIVHINTRNDSHPESICAIKVNEYIQKRVHDLMVNDNSVKPWLSFISRDIITRSAPKEIWGDWRRMHLDDIVQNVYFAYILYEVLGITPS